MRSAPVLLELVGFLLVVAGLAMWTVPGALIVAGTALVASSAVVAAPRPRVPSPTGRARVEAETSP